VRAWPAACGQQLRGRAQVQGRRWLRVWRECVACVRQKGIRGWNFAVCPDPAHGKDASFAVCPAI